MNELEVFDVLIKKSMENNPMLKNYKILLKEKTVSTKFTKYTCYEIEFYSNTLNRKISMSLVDYYTHILIGMHIYYMVDNDTRKFHNSISLLDYLGNHLKIDNFREYLELSKDPNMSLECKLQLFFDKLLPVLDNTFYEILEGKTWVDVPWFDWRSFVGM